MNPVILGNVISFIGAMIMISTGFIKKKNHILYAQCVQLGFMGTGNFILGGITGAISNVIGILRNLLGLHIKFTLAWKLLFISIEAVFVILFNKVGIIGWLPFVAAFIFITFLNTKNERVFKTAIIFSQIMWGLYDLYIMNYAAMTFDILTVGSNIVGIIAITRSIKASEEKQK